MKFMPEICLKVKGWEGRYNTNETTLTLNDRKQRAHYTSSIYISLIHRLICIFVCVPLCMYHSCANTHGGQKRVAGLLEPELQMVVSSLQMLGTERASSESAATLLTAEPLLQQRTSVW